MTTATLENEAPEVGANGSDSEAFERLRAALVRALELCKENGEVEQLTAEKLTELDDEAIEELEIWVDDVQAVAEEDDDLWPMVPAALKALLVPPPPKAETRVEAVERLEAEIEARKASLDRAKVRAMEASEESKAAKKAAEAAQERLDMTVQEWIDARHGDWQPQLPFPKEASEQPAATKQVDPAKVTAISELDITPSQIEKLEDADIATIAELEAAMREDKLRKVKGIGLAAIDKISDAVMAWRQVNGYGIEAA